MQTHSQSLSCSRIYIRRRPMYSLKILGVLLTEQPRAVFWSVTKSPRNRRKHFRGQHTAGGKQSPSDWFHARRRAKCRSINNNNNKKQLRIFLCRRRNFERNHHRHWVWSNDIANIHGSTLETKRMTYTGIVAIVYFCIAIDILVWFWCR